MWKTYMILNAVIGNLILTRIYYRDLKQSYIEGKEKDGALFSFFLNFFYLIICLAVTSIPLIGTVTTIVALYTDKETQKEVAEKKETERMEKFRNLKRSAEKALTSLYLPGISEIEKAFYMLQVKYDLIAKSDLYQEMARNRMEYIMTILSELYNMNLSDDRGKNTQLMQLLYRAIQETDMFFDTLLNDIGRAKRETDNQVREYLTEKIKTYASVTEEMHKGLKDINEKSK